MKLIFRQHAIQRMFERGISFQDVEEVLSQANVIGDYPEDVPYPSQLLLGQSGGRHLHLVVAINGGERIIVTAYEPDPARWSADFSTRRKA